MDIVAKLYSALALRNGDPDLILEAVTIIRQLREENTELHRKLEAFNSISEDT